jgi:DNA helicase HerA-like ATPase
MAEDKTVAIELPKLIDGHESPLTDAIPIPAAFEHIGKVVQWEGSPNFLEVAAVLNPACDVRPGQFVAVWHGRRNQPVLTIVQVANCRDVNPNEAPELAVARDRLGLGTSYASEAVSTRIHRLMEGPTVEEIEFEIGANGEATPKGSPFAVERLVRAGDPVVLLSDDLVARTIGSLPKPDDGLHLGEVYGDRPVSVTLAPQALQMHVGIFGNPGKGKSYCAGVVMEEALQWGIPTLVLDINGEMIAAAKSLGGLILTLPDKRFGLSLSLITPAELLQVTPNVQEGTIYAELIELAHDRLRGENKGQPITFSELIAKILEIGKLTDAKPPSVNTAISRVRALEQDPIIGGNFDFVGELAEHRLIVLDCRYLTLRQTRLIAAAAARELQRVGRDAARKAEAGDTSGPNWFALLMVDEAHQVAPTDEGVVSSQVMFELARMGRHVRTGLILISQSPSDLNSSVLKRLQTRMIFALEKDQLRAIQGVMADLDERLVAKLPKLPLGVCGVSGSSELVRHGFLMRVRERQTPVGGTTPKVFSGRTKSPLKIVRRLPRLSEQDPD